MDITVDIGGSLSDARAMLLSPKKFLKEVKKQKSWKSAFSFTLVIAAIGHILAGLYNLLIYPLVLPWLSQTFGLPQTTFEPGQIVTAMLVSFALTLGMTFVWGGALKVFLSLFRVESSFDQSYRVMAYSRVPNYLFSWLPFVNILAALYSFYLMFLVLKSEYGISNRKAIIVIISSVLALLLLSILLFALAPSI